jgi:hypothetical protein
LTIPVKVNAALKRQNQFKSLRLSIVIVGLGFLTFLPLYGWIKHLQAIGKSPASLAMPSMHMEKMSIYWSFPVLQAS